MAEKIYGAIEAGGTKFICAIGRPNGEIIEHISIPTTDPGETLGRVNDYFKGKDNLAGIGVGSFGPVDLNPESEKYGSITAETPKPHWVNTNVRGILNDELGIPITIDTDVNCAGIGEYLFGKAVNINNFAYVTVGTGIGGSVLVNGKPLKGGNHTELGHMRIPALTNWPGVCAYHGNCLEGLASGPALHKRYNDRPEDLNDGNAWNEEAKYLAFAATNILMTTGAQKIIFGGGVMQHEDLITHIQNYAFEYVNNYLKLDHYEDFIVKSELKLNAIHGAIQLAQKQ